MNGARCLVAAGFGVSAMCAVAHGQPRYSLTEIGGRPFSLYQAYDIGPEGQVVGRSYNLNTTPVQSRACVWREGVMTTLDGPGGETVTEARCIDDRGVIYGGFADRRFPLNQLRMNPVRWVPPEPPNTGEPSPLAYDNNAGINSATIFACAPTAGTAVGWAKPFVPGAPGWRGEFGYANELDFGAGDPVRAFRWSEAAGSTGTTVAKFFSAHDDKAAAINDAGQIALQLGGFERGGPAILDPRFGVARLPVLGGVLPQDPLGGFVMAINEAGTIAGRALAPAAGGAVDRPVIWREGRCIDLGLLPGFVEGAALDIAADGTVVGGLSNTRFEFGVRNTAGFIVLEGTMYNLNNLVPAPNGFVIHEAVAISSGGQILVVMNPPPNSPSRYAVLTPSR